MSRRRFKFFSGVERSFIVIFELVDIFRQVPCLSAGTSFLLQGFVRCSFLEFWSTRITLMRFTFLITPRDGYFLSRFFHVVLCALGEFDCVI